MSFIASKNSIALTHNQSAFRTHKGVITVLMFPAKAMFPPSFSNMEAKGMVNCQVALTWAVTIALLHTVQS